MHTDIGQAITFELKRDIANRYFGFRKLIEEDKLALADRVHQYTFILEKRISFELIRIYILLKDEALIEKFLDLAGLEKRMFYDPYLTESKTIRNRVFEGITFRGLTQKGSYKNALMDCYDRLVNHVQQYREKFAELTDDQEMITEEIKLFYRQNDLNSILDFLRSLGNCDSALNTNMQGGLEPDIAMDIEKKLLIAPPCPIDQCLPVMPPMPPLTAIRKELKKIAKLAFSLHKEDIHSFTQTPKGRIIAD